MERLLTYGIPQEVVDIWTSTEGPELLPVQEAALTEHGLMEGNSIIITAPSSSGKTFVGEMAAIAAFYRGKKTIFLVPMKAVAEERYADFRAKYQEFGLRIVISTRERTEFDEAIGAGHFHIAIVIFEKMTSLLTQHPALLNSCGLVVVDELQLLNDPQRGGDLEILLTKLKSCTDPLQFLGLSAVLSRLSGFPEWLGASHCDIRTRPLELYEGLLTRDGHLRARGHNSQQWQTVALQGVQARRPVYSRDWRVQEAAVLPCLTDLARYYLGMGKKVLVFRRWRNLAEGAAIELGRVLDLPPASEVVDALIDVEDSDVKDRLLECLPHGVAFHHGDIPPEARIAIERDFRSREGRIQVVCATSTLAMGVNLPASVVLLPDLMKVDSQSEQFHEVPMTTSEYKNMAGRAGRTRYREEGYSVLMPSSQAEATQTERIYILGGLDELRAPLASQDLRKTVLDLVASQSCNDEPSLFSLLLSTFTGHQQWNASATNQRAFSEGLHDCIEQLLSKSLLTRAGEGLQATAAGRLCAISGVDVDSFVLLRDALGNTDPEKWHYCQVILPALHAREFSSLIRIEIPEWTVGQDVWRVVAETFQDYAAWVESWLEDHHGMPGYQRLQALVLLAAWIEGTGLRTMERAYGRRARSLAGTMRKLGETASWMAKTVESIARAEKYPDNFVRSLGVLGERLLRGVPAEGVELDRLGVQGLNRPAIARLVAAGLTSPDSILDADDAALGAVIPRRLGERLRARLIELVEDSQQHRLNTHLQRLRAHGRDGSLVRDIYTKEGIELERSVADLLQAPPLSLNARRVPRQREGEPDILLTSGQDLAVISVTASATPISHNKCADVVKSGARFNPRAFVVVGRPGFHEQAVTGMAHLSTQLKEGKTCKLISIADLAEVYVLVCEGKTSPGRVLAAFMEESGLIDPQQLSSS